MQIIFSICLFVLCFCLQAQVHTNRDSLENVHNKVITRKLPWVTFSDSIGGYSLILPDKPIQYTDRDEADLVYIYKDTAQNLTYTFYYVNHMYSDYEIESGDAFQDITDRISSGGEMEIIREGRLRNWNLNGKEIIVKTNKDYQRAQIFISKAKVYLMLLNGSLDEINSEDADKYFYSLEITGSNAEENNWIFFYNATAGASIYLPEEPDYEYVEVPNPEKPDGDPYKVHLLSCLDQEHQVYYFLRYNDFPNGFVIEDDENFFESMEDNLVNNLQVLPSQVTEYYKDGYPAREYEFYNAGGNSYVRVNLLLRGSRAYLLMSQMDMALKDSSFHLPFFDSFRYEDFDEVTYERYNNPDIGITLDMPVYPVLEVDTFLTSLYSDLDYSYTVSSVDTNSGVSFFMVCDVYPEYFRVDDLDKMIANIGETFYELGDSLLSEKDILVEGYKGKELLLKEWDVHTFLKARFILRENYLYQLYCFLPREELYSGRTDRFFESVKFSELPNTTDMLSSKAEKIFSDLLSTDSLTQFKAYKALDYYPFANEDLPLLYEAIRKDYPGDSMVFTTIKNMLLHVLEYAHDKTTVGFIDEIYDTYSNDYVKQLLLLETLSKMQTVPSVDLLCEKLKNPPKAIEYFELYNLFDPLLDSLEIFERVYPRLIHLFNKPYYDTHMAELSNDLIDSGIVDLSFIEDHYKTYENAFVGMVTGFREMDDLVNDNYNNTLSTLISLIELLERMPPYGVFEAELLKLTGEDNMMLKLEAALVLEKHGKTVPSKVWKQLLKDEYYTFDVLEGLQAINKYELAGKKYADQKVVAELDLKNWLLNMDDEMKIKFIEERTAKIHGKEKLLYIYKVYSKFDKMWFMGVSGPQPLDKTKLNFKSEITDVFFDHFNEVNLDKLMQMVEYQYND